MTENKRFIVDDAGTLIDIQTRECYDLVEEVVDLLNSKEELIKQLKVFEDYQAYKIKELQKRNDRQYDSLTHLWTCIENKDWETLTKEWEELEEADKKLQEEWACYENF